MVVRPASGVHPSPPIIGMKSEILAISRNTCRSPPLRKGLMPLDPSLLTFILPCIEFLNRVIDDLPGLSIVCRVTSLSYDTSLCSIHYFFDTRERDHIENQNPSTRADFRPSPLLIQIYHTATAHFFISLCRLYFTFSLGSISYDTLIISSMAKKHGSFFSSQLHEDHP